MIHHYYHIYADGQWRIPLEEHIAAVSTIGEKVVTKVGIVGKLSNVHQVYEVLPEDWEICSWANEGWEQETLDLIYMDAAEINGPVLYAHTKGAGIPMPYSDDWRRCMNRIITDSKVCLDLLATGHDTVGCHLLTPERWPQIGDKPFYGGNFWWATSEHIRRLGPPENDTRFHAEAWLTSVLPNNPANLVPGWPGGDCHKHLPKDGR